MIDWIATEMWAGAAAQVVILLIGCLATAWAVRSKRKWPATIGLKASILALALSMFNLASSYARVLEIRGFTPSLNPPVPLDQQSSAIGAVFSVAPLFIGQCVAVILPAATWAWIRVQRPEPEHRALRLLAVAAAGVMTLALLGASYWHREFIFDYRIVCRLYGCMPHGWAPADPSFAMLERIRVLVVIAGAALGVAAVAYAVAQARRNARPDFRTWAALLALFGVAAAAKLWTADERRDTRDYFHLQPRGHGGFQHLQKPVADPYMGPELEHCSFEWPGADLINVDSQPERQADDRLVGDIEWLDHCGAPEGLDAILAEPELEIARIKLALQTADAEGLRRLGVASVRPIPVTRVTTGEFVRLQTCVVEFSLGPNGVSLDQFSTWGDLAKAADAADGGLVIAPPPR